MLDLCLWKFWINFVGWFIGWSSISIVSDIEWRVGDCRVGFLWVVVGWYDMDGVLVRDVEMVGNLFNYIVGNVVGFVFSIVVNFVKFVFGVVFDIILFIFEVVGEVMLFERVDDVVKIEFVLWDYVLVDFGGIELRLRLVGVKGKLDLWW